MGEQDISSNRHTITVVLLAVVLMLFFFIILATMCVRAGNITSARDTNSAFTVDVTSDETPENSPYGSEGHNYDPYRATNNFLVDVIHNGGRFYLWIIGALVSIVLVTVYMKKRRNCGVH